jgi:hypothetical protein
MVLTIPYRCHIHVRDLGALHIACVLIWEDAVISRTDAKVYARSAGSLRFAGRP